MKCVNCGLLNPENAARCDCGYDFATQTIKAPFFSSQQSSLWKLWMFWLISPAIFIAVGPPVGYFSSILIQDFVRGRSSSFTARDFGLLFGLLPMAYVIGAIPALSTGITYEMVSLMLPKILQSFLWRGLLGGAIGVASTTVYCQFVEFDPDLAFWAGLPAGVICSLLPQNRPPKGRVSGSEV